jgi:hypothetical protein
MVACHTITVTDYRFTWCSVVMNVIFNTCFVSVIYHIGKYCFKDFLNCHFELFMENCMKVIITGQTSLELRVIKVFEITR